MALTRRGKLFAGALFAGALFGSQPDAVTLSQVVEAGNAGHAKRAKHNPNWPYAKQTVQFDIDADDREIVEILTIMSTFL